LLAQFKAGKSHVGQAEEFQIKQVAARGAAVAKVSPTLESQQQAMG
jgi:hypothetical protein